MTKINENMTKTLIESELSFLSLFKLTYCLFKAYLICIYIKLIKITKFYLFVSFVKIFVSNLKTRFNYYSQRRHILEWIESKVKEPLHVTNFNDDWKDGILLCALIEAVVPGSCPRFDLLNADNAIDNINLGLSLIKKYLNIDSPIESQEVHDCTQEAKLVYLLSRIKFESLKLIVKSLIKRPIIEMRDSCGNNHKMFESLFGNEKACFAKGMGLILGVRTRRARFNIFCKPMPKLDLTIEINGPNNTFCVERISVFNTKRRMTADVITSALIADFIGRKKTPEDVLKIPFFYEVFPNRIVVTYIPLMVGIHKLSVIWQGQHILHSPYTVKVEDCSQNPMEVSDQLSNSHTAMKFMPGAQYPVPGVKYPVARVQFPVPGEKSHVPTIARSNSIALDDCATVVSRKVIKQMIVINGKQHVINDFSEHLISEDIEYKNNFNDNDMKVENDYKNDNNSRNMNKYVLNELNKDTELFDLRDSDTFDMNDSNGDNYDNFDRKQNVQNMIISQDFHNLSNSLQTNNINKMSTNDETIEAIAEDIETKASTFMSEQILNNYCYKSYIPVKDMISNWESKLSKNVNQTIESNIRCDINRPSNHVRNRCHNSETFTQNNNQMDSNANEEQLKRDSNECMNFDMNSQNLSITANYNELQNEPIISLAADMRTPESLTDSGFCNKMFINVFKDKALRQKSLSFPNINKVDDKYIMRSDVDVRDDPQNTDTSSLSGQYIDDEIPDYSNLFGLGSYVSYTRLLNTEIPLTFDSIKFSDIYEEENDFNVNRDRISRQDLGIYPEKCEVFGAGAYYGQVGIKNQFVVSTKDGGMSYLAVGVQSSEADDVIGVSFTAIGQYRYEVQYEVCRPGYYVIFVKWGDYNIADSPFICKVTF